jgi:starch phosphorylase
MVFTTHTPVAAGHDAFDPGTIDYYLGDYYRELGLSRSEFMSLGRLNPSDEGEPFSMTILALRLAGRSNGVSILHGELSRRLWGGVWPGLAEEEVPTGSVTNGVHLRTWLAPELADLYEGLKSPDAWTGSLESTERLRAIDEAPARELWDRHERLRAELVHWVRARLASQFARQNAGPSEVSRAVEALDPKTLTIGFARRFAEYKRATLLLRDPDRLIRLVNDPHRPVQFIFAGKAHPSDNGGKELLRYLVELSKRDEVRGRIVVLEDYDIGVARRMVQGVDVWLNTPRRPLEASGTSGMKAVANGALHVGTLDGWWDEAYRAGLGWAIGDRRSYDDPNQQDQLEALSLYDLLERELVPMFYDRDAAGLPQGWIGRMRASMGGLPAVFNTDRMVHEYLKQYYEPAARDVRRLSEVDLGPTREVAAWVARVYDEWPKVQVVRMNGLADTIAAGTALDIEAEISLGGLSSDEVEVHLAHGLLDGDGVLTAPLLTSLEPLGEATNGNCRYGVRGVHSERSGRHGYAIRVTPRHPSLPTPYPLGLVRWSD